jgi:hypothetical protein
MKLSSGKVQLWECKKPPVDTGTFCRSSILVFYVDSSMPETSSRLRIRTLCTADARRFRKSLKIKMTGKLPEIHCMGGEIQDLHIFGKLRKKYNSH